MKDCVYNSLAIKKIGKPQLLRHGVLFKSCGGKRGKKKRSKHDAPDAEPIYNSVVFYWILWVSRSESLPVTKAARSRLCKRCLVMLGHKWASVTLTWWIGSSWAQQKEWNKWYQSVREIIVEGLCDFLSDSDRGKCCSVIGKRAPIQQRSYATYIKCMVNYYQCPNP